MTQLAIKATTGSYEVLVGAGLLERSGSLLAERIPPSVCAIVSDTNVAPLFAKSLSDSLTRSGFEPILITIRPGETSKTLTMAETICDRLVTGRLDRSSVLIALGGGVVGDLAGFAAAVFHRGIRYVQIPTTLLAQVDSSIGGKTAVNTVTGKNLIGAWHHPALVIADTDTLATLPPHEWRQGFAEVIKHAIIRDAELFEMLQNFERRNIEELVRRNIELKGAIVAADERETKGERALLNFGHTVGHAIESAGGYHTLSHGEAVSLGIVVASAISTRKAGLTEADRNRIVRTLEMFDLPTQLPASFPSEKILETIRVDKKFVHQKVRFIVTPAIGSARLASDVTMEDIADGIALLLPRGNVYSSPRPAAAGSDGL